MHIKSHFSELKFSKKIWAIGSIHSHIDSFTSIAKLISKNFSQGDKLIFLGNIIGFGENSTETLTNALNLRHNLLSNFQLDGKDVIFLRGAQEEMFLKLLQLQTAPNPYEIIKWMFEHGVDKTIESYGFNKNEITDISTQGTLSISRWTAKLIREIKSFPGHNEYFSDLKHAAFTDKKKILFVNRGVDVSRPLSAQNDCFWWGYQNFSMLDQPYQTFLKIVRGYSSSLNKNFENSNNQIVCSLYKPPLENKKVIAGLFNELGDVLDMFESS